jgi:16S rRNA (cytosine1402-N4)-methyltransferase
MIREITALFTADQRGGWVIDGTLGGGGHAAELLGNTPSNVRYLGIDRDPNAITAASSRLTPFGDRVKIIQGRFGEMRSIANEHCDGPIKGILVDLGVSSAQLDQADRGFSFQADGPLDMDMSARGEERALMVLRTIGIPGLTRALSEYGDVPRPGTVARILCEAVGANKIQGTRDLAELIAHEFPWLRKGNKHPATRVFQALRMVVNDEPGELESVLNAIPELLGAGGTAALISYHSFEDRAVKLSFRELKRDKRFEVLTKKPMLPMDDEVQSNPRARSAKLRALRRTEVEG